MTTHLKKAIGCYFLYYLVCRLIYPFATGSFAMVGNAASISIDLGSAAVVFIGSILVGLLNGRFSKEHIEWGEKMIATFSIIGITVLIDAINWGLHGYFIGKGTQIFFAYLLTFPVIGGFIVLGGISLGNRFVNGKQPE